MRTKILAAMTPEWQECYKAGIFTEFMEQRAPGHTVADDKIYRKGFLAFKADIATALADLDYLNDKEALKKEAQLNAMDICCDAIMLFAVRHAEEAERLAAQESDVLRQAELKKIAAICRKVPANPPETFYEALQTYWFVHVGVISELNNWDSFNPGRLDQHLFPFYEKELAAGSLTPEAARELLQCFWIKFNNQPAPPKVGITLAESSTYTDFANINSGGLKADGSDGVNEVSYLILEVIDEMRLLQPSSNVQISKKTPNRFLKKACEVIRHGNGQPSVFNADEVIEEMLRAGKSIEDARNGGTSGCVETGAFGKEAYILTGYFNLPKILEKKKKNGFDTFSGLQLGLQTGKAKDFHSFEDFFAAFKIQLNYFADIKIRGNNVIEKLYAEYMPAPFLSVIIDDCIKNGKDYNAGGARYNTSYIQGVGIGTLTDSLSAIKYQIFDQKNYSLMELVSAAELNFSAQDKLYRRLLDETPKYGNDDDYADNLMRLGFDAFYDAVNGRPNVKGGCYRIDMLPTTCHVYFGSVIGATPDGRKAKEPLSEGISPAKGADRNGPTAVIKSAAKMDHVRTGGTLLNQKFTPAVLADEAGMNGLISLIRTYFTLDGHHIQFNVVDKKTLQQAQLEPDKYRDLIVRVAGYSDYFCNLSKALQDEIILRTEQDFS